MREQNERGRSLVEMLAVVSIMGVLLVGAMSALRFGMTSMQVSSAYNLIENIAEGVGDLYSWNRGYPEESDAAAMRQRILASSDACEGCKASATGAVEVDLPWGLDGDNAMIIQPGDKDHFEILLPAVPKDVCLRLQAMQWNYAEWVAPEKCQRTRLERRKEYVEGIIFHVH